MAGPMIFGEIAGNPRGTTYADRLEVHSAGLHRHTQSGISGRAAEGSDAIALNGGYVDDRDYGDVII